MSIRFALLCVIFHSAIALCIDLPDESAMDPLVRDLKSKKPEVREAAAIALRKIAVSNQKAVEQSGEYWKSKVALIKTGMTSAEVHEILPPFPTESLTSGPGSGDSHCDVYHLDCHWTITIYYNNPDSVHPTRPVLSKWEMSVWVKPPEQFTGKWTCWHTNGEKHLDIDYKDGKYDGLFIAYHDNGQKCYEQTYSDNQIGGHESGWHATGKKRYDGQYKDGKQDGTWTWWFDNGTKQSEKSFKNGVEDGPDLSWFENGQQGCENHYKDGKKVGREAAWDKDGKLLYEHQLDSEK